MVKTRVELNEQKIAKIIEDYKNPRNKVYEIARKYKISTTIVYDILKAHKIPIRQKTIIFLTEETEREIMNLFHMGKTKAQISRKLNLPYAKIGYTIDKHKK